jgi:hypothetical protein
LVNAIKSYILIVPHLRENTTSIARFTSIAEALLKRDLNVVIFEIEYTIKKGFGLGHDLSIEDLKPHINKLVFKIKPKFNFLQEIAFSNHSKKIFKVFNVLNQLITGKDVFYPGKIFVDDLNLGYAKSGDIIVFGGPFSLFQFGDELANKLNYRLILDYRDPWTFGYPAIDSNRFIQRYKNKFYRKIELNLLQKASIITTVSKTLKSYFPTKIQPKIHVILNGGNFDIDPSKIIYRPLSFNLVYLGTIYNEQLIDETFFKVLSVFLKNKNNTEFKLYFLGAHLNTNLKKVLSKYELDSFTEITKRLNNDELSEILYGSSVFLHLKYGNKSGIITSKHQDYLSFKKPILLPMSDFGDLEETIINENSGFVCYNEQQVLEILEKLWSDFKLNKKIIIKSHATSRADQADLFVKILTSN